jgi:hypothetical protein
MVPHSLFVSSDRQVDLALNLLTLIVGGGLLAAAAFLVFTWIRPTVPVSDRGEVGPPAWAAMSDVLFNPPRLELELQLTYVPTIYRCEHRGQVTYSDHPCKAGRARSPSARPS